MKISALKSIFFIAFSLLLLTSCVNDDDYAIPNLECKETDLVANKTVQQVFNQAGSFATLYEINDVIEGYVVSSDKGKNFYKVIYLTSLDGQIGFSVSINEVATAVDYGVGRKVFIRLRGLYTQRRNSILQIGALFNGNVGQIPTTDYPDHLVRSCAVVEESTLLNELTLADVNDGNIGKLIEFRNVQFTDAALGQNYYNPQNVVFGETNHILTDASGATLIFRTGVFSEYSGIPVPTNSGKIRGILTKFSSGYQFVARYNSDIQLTEPRF